MTRYNTLVYVNGLEIGWFTDPASSIEDAVAENRQFFTDRYPASDISVTVENIARWHGFEPEPAVVVRVTN